jgi:hypothetical protein
MTLAGSLHQKMSGVLGVPSTRDARGRRLVATIECLLNQNCRDADPAAMAADLHWLEQRFAGDL